MAVLQRGAELMGAADEAAKTSDETRSSCLKRLVSTSQLPPLQYANLVKCDYSECQASSCFGTREFPSQSKLLFLIVILPFCNRV